MVVVVSIFALLAGHAASPTLHAAPGVGAIPQAILRGGQGESEDLPSLQVRINAALAEVIAGLAERQDGRALELGDSRHTELLTRAWDLFGEWAAGFLDQYPDASAPQLAASFGALHTSVGPPAPDDLQGTLDVEALRLTAGDETAHVVMAKWGWTSTFFVVARDSGGRFAVPWRVYEVAVEHLPAKDDLGRWAHFEPGFHDGPLAGTLRLLPSSADRSPRFLVDAITLPLIGGNRPGQIGIWEWEGRQATPLFIKTYETHWESRSVEWLGDRIIYHANLSLDSFWTCGTCVGPQIICELGLDARGADDRGCDSRDPELELFDQIVQRLIHRRDASDIASDAVSNRLLEFMAESNRQTAESLRETEPPPLDSFSFGQLGDHSVSRWEKGTRLHVSTDEAESITLTTQRRGDRLFATELVIEPW